MKGGEQKSGSVKRQHKVRHLYVYQANSRNRAKEMNAYDNGTDS